MQDYTNRFNFAKNLALECGNVALSFYNKNGGAKAKSGVQIDSKTNLNDLVTAGDQATEKYFIEQVRKNFPNDKILGEETDAGQTNNSKVSENFENAPESLKNLNNGEPVWIVDPIDGTMSFVHGFDYWCVSIGFVAEGEIIFGVILQPTRNWLYSGYIGKGSFIENLSDKSSSAPTQLKSSTQKTIQGSLLMGSMAKCYWPLQRKALQIGIHGIRSPGAAALMLCDVASGSCDFYTHTSLHAWDLCAGARIVLEAGGRLYNNDFSGEFDLFSRQIGACATVELAKDLNENLSEECKAGNKPGCKALKRDVLAWA